MIKAIINYNDVDDEFRRMNDILGVLKHQYKNIDISYNKIIPRVCRNGNKNELFVTINNEKLDCNHSLGFYMQAVEKYIK
ncbi:hypothetical protein OFS07_00500 [Brachyspira hyodysenteriae]|nr:hypothetical protein [Brachyspira hyodysenteriae]KLI22323.1 hypothetical protein SU43_08410 [Brachyspira hyodysenteriae]KLI28437.1 hypothetical protein SZ49_12840 [Brachyspira hyodysenteriae]MDA0062934.1 hypothetical protein [Brachyspira hyodysenteriae]MDA0063671.1 hypothetical protein [Brachyspira hyodysenteriae]MDA0064768.1 hypothetical protein [Brachyspira hyodysenteriae]